MARIRPFKALLPRKDLVQKIVTRPLEDYSLGEARLIASENACSFLHLISPELDFPYLRGSRQELIYKTISENVEDFLEQSYLEQVEQETLFIYRVRNQDRVHTGYWVLTSVFDNKEGVILKHEQTVSRREKLLADYLQQTTLDAIPVLITHKKDAELDRYIALYTTKEANFDFEFADGTTHQLWAVTDEKDVLAIQKAFEKLNPVYLADGHHRIASMTNMAVQKEVLDKDSSFNSKYNFFSSVYMDESEVKIFQFHRLVRDLNGLDCGTFLSKLASKFEIENVVEALVPKEFRSLGMYLDGKWYKLIPKASLFNGDPVNDLDVSILHNHILQPILGINDPRADARIIYEGGLVPLQKLVDQVDRENFEVAFTLCPTSLDQIKQVADAQKVMPPKSTWVEPKFLVGLVTNYFG